MLCVVFLCLKARCEVVAGENMLETNAFDGSVRNTDRPVFIRGYVLLTIGRMGIRSGFRWGVDEILIGPAYGIIQLNCSNP
jgi:hypothetical protein